jgi:integrase
MPLRSKNGKFHYRFQVAGKTFSGSTGLEAVESNRATAARIEREAKTRALITPDQARPKRIAFSEVAKRFEAWVTATYQKPNSCRAILGSLTSLKLFFQRFELAAITPGDIDQYKAWRLSTDVKANTIRKDLSNLSLLFRYAIRQRWVTENPCREVRKPAQVNATDWVILTEDDERRYFAEAQRFPDLFDFARLILLQGLRPDEVFRLRAQDVDLERGLLHVRTGKTKSAKRTLRLGAESKSILGARLARVKGSWLFPSPVYDGQPRARMDHAHGEVLIATGLVFRLYDLRHTFATRAAQAGIDLASLAAILGHSGLRAVLCYVHPTLEHQMQAMERLDAMRKPWAEVQAERPIQ